MRRARLASVLLVLLMGAFAASASGAPTEGAHAAQTAASNGFSFESTGSVYCVSYASVTVSQLANETGGFDITVRGIGGQSDGLPDARCAARQLTFHVPADIWGAAITEGRPKDFYQFAQCEYDIVIIVPSRSALGVTTVTMDLFSGDTCLGRTTAFSFRDAAMVAG